jgi:hypothetical protein
MAVWQHNEESKVGNFRRAETQGGKQKLADGTQ